MYHSPATDSIYVIAKQYLAIFMAHLWFVICITLLALSIGIFSTLTSPDEYTSVTTVNFDSANSNPFAGSRAVDGSFIATQVNLLSSKTVTQRVVDSLGESDLERLKQSIWDDYTLVDSVIGWIQEKLFFLLESLLGGEEIDAVDSSASELGQSSLTQGNFSNGREGKVEYSWMTGAILARLTVTPVLGSSNISLKYVSIDPYISSLVVNGLAREFSEYSLERNTKPAERTKEWLDEQLAVLRSRLENAQGELTRYQQQQRVVSDEDRLDIEEVKLQQLSNQLSDLQRQTKAQETRWQQIKSSKGEALETIPQIINDPVIQTIKGDIRNLERQLTEVSSKFGENHPQYKSVVAELGSARRKYSKEIRSIASSAEKEAKLAKQTEDNIALALEEQKNLVLQLKNQKDEISVLQRAVDSHRETYNAALVQYNQSNLQSLVGQTSVNVVDFAAPPKIPSGPSMVKNAVMSLILGLIIALGIVFLKEFFNRKIRCREDVFVSDDIQLLGIIGR